MNDTNREQPWLQIMVLLGAVGVLLLALLLGRGVRLTETYTSDDGTLTFRYPEGWIIEHIAGTIQLASTQGMIRSPQAIPNEVLVAIVPSSFATGSALDTLVAEAASPIDALQAVLATLPTDRPDSAVFEEPVSITISGREAATVKGTNNVIDVVIMVLDEGDGGYFSILVASVKGDLAPFEPVALAIAASLRYTP